MSIFLLSFLLGLGALLVGRLLIPQSSAGLLPGDYENTYLPLAEEMVATHRYYLKGQFSTRVPPGYPLLVTGALILEKSLGLTHAEVLQILQLTLAGASAALVGVISSRVWGKGWGLIAAVGWASYPFNLWLSRLPFSEMAMIFCLYLAVLLFLHSLDAPRPALRLFCVGLLAGGAMLVRPIAIGTPLILTALAVFLLPARKLWLRIALAGLVLIGALLTIAPWEIHAFQQTGQWIPLSSLSSSSLRLGFTYGVALNDMRSAGRVPPDVAGLMERILEDTASTLGSQGILAKAAEAARWKPRLFLKMMLIKTGQAWYLTDSGILDRLSALIQIPYLLLFLCSGILCLRSHGPQRRLALIIGSLVMYFWLMSWTTIPLLRYMVPAIGLCFILLPATGSRLLSWLGSKRPAVQQGAPLGGVVTE